MDFGFSAAWAILKDAFSFVQRRREAKERQIVRRLDLKREIERNFPSADGEGMHGYAIIRNVSKADAYPDSDTPKRKISPWFKVELKGIYFRGIEVCLGVDTLFFDPLKEQWGRCHHTQPGSISAIRVGRIPFDVITNIDWHGDEFYPDPHFYCRYTLRKGEPYEKILYYRPLQGKPANLWPELVDYDLAKKNELKSA